MKLHLPSSLRKALLACLAAFALPVSLPVTVGTGALISFLAAQQAAAITLTPEASTYNGFTYSGKIYTISGKLSFHEATFTQLQAVDGADASAVFGPYTGNVDRYNDEGINTPSFLFWQNVWCAGTATAGNGSRHGQTLRFANSEESITYAFTFDPLHLGGIITESGNNGEYILNGSGASTRRLLLESSAASQSVKFTVKSDLRLMADSTTQTATYSSNAEWHLASGKTLTWQNYNVTTDANKSITVSRLDTVAAEGDIVAHVLLDKNLTIGAGGVLTVNNGIDMIVEGDLSAADVVVHGGDLRLMRGINTAANLTIDQGGELIFNADLTLDDNYNISVGENSKLTFNGTTTVNRNLTLEQNSALTFGTTTTISEGTHLKALQVDGSITFNGDADIQGTLEVERGGTITFNGNATIAENAALLYTNGTGTVGGTYIFNGEANILVNGEIDLSQGKKLILREGATLGRTTINLGAGGQLLVSSGVLDATNGATINCYTSATITLDTTGGAQLKVNSNTFKQNYPLTIILQGAMFTEGWEYQLYTDDSEIPQKEIGFDRRAFIRGITDVVFDEDNPRLIHAIGTPYAAELTWQGKNEGMTWENGLTGWTTEDADAAFHPMDDVIFAGADTVTMESEMTTGQMKVEGDYIFTGGGVTVTGDAGLVIAQEASAVFENSSLTSSFGIDVQDNAELTLKNTHINLLPTGEEEEGHGLVLNSGARVTISGDGDKHFAAEDAVGVQIGKDATLRVEDISNWQGYVQNEEGTLELASGGLRTGRYLFYTNKHINTTDDAYLGKLLGDSRQNKLILTNDTLLQIDATEQVERLNNIRTLEVTAGSVFAWRSATELGLEDTQLILAGEGVLTDGPTTYKGALQIGVFLDDDTAATYTLNSSVVLSDDSTIYVYGRKVENGAEGEPQTIEQRGCLTGLYTGNGHTLSKQGKGVLEFGSTFHTDGKQSGSIEVYEGRLLFNYTDTEALQGQDIWVYGTSSTHATLTLGESAQVSSYTIGALSGGGKLEKAQNGQTIELRFVNSYEERNQDNTFSGTFDNDIVMHVMGGYQAFAPLDALAGELTMKASHGGTLDLEELRLEPDQGYALHLTAGTPGTEATDDQEATEGTDGTLKMNGYYLSAGASMDVTLYSGSSLEMSNSGLIGGVLDVPNFTLMATASEADLSGSSVGDSSILSITLKDDSTLRMMDVELGNDVELLLSAEASVMNLSGLTASDNLIITIQGEMTEDGEESAGLAAGAEINISNADIGNRANVFATVDRSTLRLSNTTFGERAIINLSLTGGSVADLSRMTLGGESLLEINALNSDTNLEGMQFDIIPPAATDLSPVEGGMVRLTATGGTHNLRNMTFGQKVMLNLEVMEDAWVMLENSTPATGLQVIVEGTDAVLEGMQVGLGSRITAVDGMLNLAGQNTIRLNSELSRLENAIFSDTEINLLEGAKLRVDATDVLPEVLAEIGKERIYYIADADLTAWSDKLSFGAELALLNVHVSLGKDGSVSFRALGVSADSIYLASRDNDSKGGWGYQGDIYSSTDEKTAVYIDRETTIDLRGKQMGLKEDGLVLKNLMGTTEGNLFVYGDGTGQSMITISNNFSDVSLTELEQAINVKIDHERITFNGNIDLRGTDLQFRHRDGDTGTASAKSTTHLNGVLTIRDGRLIMTSGKLELATAGNDLGDVGISFAGHDGQLVVSADTKAGGTIAVISEGELDTPREEHILISTETATLTLKDGTRINTAVNIGNLFAADAEEEEELPEIDLAEGDEAADDALVDGSLPDDDAGLTEEPTKPSRVPLLAGTLSTAAGEQKAELGSKLSNVVLNLEAGSTLTIVGIGEQDPLPEEPPVVEEEEPTLPDEGEAELASTPLPTADDILTGDEGEQTEPAPQIASDWQLAGLTGEGKLASTLEHAGGIEICTAGGDKHFSGDLRDYKGTMVVLAGNDTQHFDSVSGGKDWNLINTDGGRVEFNLMGGSRKANNLTMGNLTLQSGSITTILFDLTPLLPQTSGSQNPNKPLLSLKSLVIEDGADVTLGQFEGTVSLSGKNGDRISQLLGSIDTEDFCNIGENVNWHLRGIRNASKGDLRMQDGSLYLDAVIDNTNKFAEFTTSSNASVGAGLMWGILNTYTLGGDLAAMDALLYSLLMDNEQPTAADISKANHILAALAGPSTAVLGDAVRTDMERQLRAIRNRTTTLSYGGDAYTRRHSGVWLNAENNYYKQNADGTMPGYKVTGWGGTVGAHTQVSDSATIGLALTAMYNDLQSDGPDTLKGDMDTYYLTGFAQVAHDAWRHTFVMSIGKADLDARRTVNYGEGAYTTKDTTDGYAFGLLYEVGYTIPLNIDYSLCLQPVFNVAWRVGQLGAYTEAGATNAKLHVEEQTYNSVTFGAGARLQSAFGSNIWNRTGLLETRALLKVDVGDRQGEASVALQDAGALRRGKVKSAEMGVVGVELGAGITIPTGRRGEAFADFSAELRADYTNLNATIGYKVNF